MLNIFTKYNVRPADGAGSMMKAGSYPAEVSLDVSELTPEDRQKLIREIRNLGLRTEIDEETLKVSGSVQFSFSRGVDNEGRKALWLQAEGPMADLIMEGLGCVYASKGWALSAGRALREVLVKIGGELEIPDGTNIFVGASSEYAASLLATDGSHVHPKLTDSQKAILNATSDDNIDEDEDPFK